MKLTDEQIEHVRAGCPVGLELRRDPVADTGSEFSRSIEAIRPDTAFVTSYANGFAFGIDVAAFAEKGEALPAVLALRAVPDLCDEVIALRKQVALDAESRKASQAEFARLNRELNEANETIVGMRSELDSLQMFVAGTKWRVG